MAYTLTDKFISASERLLLVKEFGSAIKMACEICDNVPMWRLMPDSIGSTPADDYFKPNRARKLEVHASVDLSLSKEAASILSEFHSRFQVLRSGSYLFIPVGYTSYDVARRDWVGYNVAYYHLIKEDEVVCIP